MADESKPLEFDFPIVDFYKNHILDGRTLIKTGGWWTAILLIEDPKDKKPFIGLYRWQKTKTGWKARKRFSFNRSNGVKEVIGILQLFAEKLAEAESKKSE